MTLILVAPGGGRSNVVAAAMAAAAGMRGARVNLGAIQSGDVDPGDFAKTARDLEQQAELVIVYLSEAAYDAQFVYQICEQIEDADIDLVLHVAAGHSTDDAAGAVDALRKVGIEPSGLILDEAPNDPEKRDESRQFLAAAVGVPVLGVVPEGAERLEPEKFARNSLSWFDEDVD